MGLSSFAGDFHDGDFQPVFRRRADAEEADLYDQRRVLARHVRLQAR